MTTVIRDSRGVITNAFALTIEQVVHERVICPACEQKVFEMWPEGWDAHAVHRCSGLRCTLPEERKAEFKSRFGHLFRE